MGLLIPARIQSCLLIFVYAWGVLNTERRNLQETENYQKREADMVRQRSRNPMATLSLAGRETDLSLSRKLNKWREKMHIGQSRDFGANFGELSSDDIYFLWNSEV